MKKADKEKRDIKLKNKALYHAEQMYLALLELNVLSVPKNFIVISLDVDLWFRKDGIDVGIEASSYNYKAFKKSEKIENALKKSKP